MFYLKTVSSFSEVCSVVVLRSINGVLTILCSVIIYEIITNLRPMLDERKATIYAVVLSMYPLHWFFSFLYYTDVASLTAVLAMYLVCLKKNYWFSGLVMDHINYRLWVFKCINCQGALLYVFLSFFWLNSTSTIRYVIFAPHFFTFIYYANILYLYHFEIRNWWGVKFSQHLVSSQGILR